MNPLYEPILVFSKFDPLTASGMALCADLGPKSPKVRRGTLGCGVTHRVRRGTISSASACCKAGPSSNLGSAPQRRPSTERKQQEAVLDEL